MSFLRKNKAALCCMASSLLLLVLTLFTRKLVCTLLLAVLAALALWKGLSALRLAENKGGLLRFGLLLWATTVSFFQFELSIGNIGSHMSFWYVLKNLFTLLLFYLLTDLLTGRLWLSLAIWSTGFSVLAIVNYYALSFRGIPVAPLDFLSAGTALNVMNSYKLFLSREVVVLVFCAAFQYFVLFVCAKALPAAHGHWPGRLAVSAAFLVLFGWYYAGNLEALLHIPQHNEWAWHARYPQEGYASVTIDKAVASLRLSVTTPKGYSEQALLADAAARRGGSEDEPLVGSAAESGSDTVQPHVILIVNESMFNWHQYTDFTTDVPVMPFFYSLENCIRGYAVNPLQTTAISEYEILNSTSMQLTPATLPFTQMNMARSYGLTQFMDDLGYETTGFHLAEGINYNRATVYPALGFQTYFFRDDDANDYDFVRWFASDACSFDYIEQIFEENHDTPQFIYCLTIQNHGGYQISVLNGGDYPLAEDKIVRVTSGFEGIETEAEEYLTLLQYTDAAFADLIAYFEQVEEPVVICMVGDHQPNFTQTVPTGYTGQEAQMRLMGAPFVMWANYPIEEADVGYVGMVQLAPMLLQIAQLPSSPFYDAISALGDTVIAPFYYRKDGEFYSYDDDVIDPAVQQYLYYACNNIPGRARNIEELFVPYTG